MRHSYLVNCQSNDTAVGMQSEDVKVHGFVGLLEE
jgi:hypothetical protein